MNDNLKAADLLDAAAELIAQPGAWTRRKGARDPDGWGCFPNDPEAAAWCAIGALLNRLPHRFMDDKIYCAAICALNDIVGTAVSAWNDDLSTTHSDVLQAFRDASANLRSTP